MVERLIIAGSGGQGIMLLGKVIAEAAMCQDRFVTWLPSYGAEVRGGTAYCMVVISDEEIGSPYVEKADSVIIMNAPSWAKFKDRLKPKGLLVINTSLAPKLPHKKKNIIQGPFSDIAVAIGNIRVANMVALGAFLAAKKLLSLKAIEDVFQAIAPADKKDLIEINKKALREGARLKW
jgi:2-oxoglutarate ferredoxin oxidoreductase subunit gamma